MQTLSRTTKCQLIFIIIQIFCMKRIADTADCDESFVWRCKSGDQCISEADRCDGTPNCLDGSDETVTECIQKVSNCKKYNFRCTYGACIVKSLTCNKKNDCADGSDELPALCDADEWNRRLKGRCAATQIECRSGECISDDRLCDGVADCGDASDETLEYCTTNQCPKLSFRCGYGACVDGNSACNGKPDCYDASDESPIMCKTTNIVQPTYQLTTTTTTTPSSFSSSSRTCEIPNDINLVVTNALNDKKINVGSVVPANIYLHFKCKSGYYLKGYNNSICSGDNEWTKKLPNCLHYCSEKHPRSGFSTVANFELDGNVNDKRVFEPGTIARITCAYFFEKPRFNFVETLRCGESGWSRTKTSCYMKCGQPEDPLTEYSYGGTKANITEVPWHVGIYHRGNDTYENICGGTIISPRVVVSAAHCFFKAQRIKQKNYDFSEYRVAAGKVYRSYNKQEINQQIRQIIAVWTHDEYKGAEHGFYRDIAIIKVDEFFKFTDAIRPACVHLPEEANQNIPSNLTGQISAWSQISAREKESSLETLHMLTESHGSCNATLIRKSFINLKGDKFCAASFGGQAFACRGDSGSGFVYRRSDSKFYLYGIVSFSPSRTQSCSRDDWLVLTNVLFYKNWLQMFQDEDLENDIDFESWNT